MLSIVINILLVIHVIVSLLIILVVLMQRPKNEGLGAAFGGGMTDQFFGAETTNVLAKVTRWLGGIFFGLTLTLSILYARQGATRNAIPQELLNAPKPPAAPLASATPAVSGSAVMQQLQKALGAAAAKSGTGISITGSNGTINLAPTTTPGAQSSLLPVAPLDAKPSESPAASTAASASPAATTAASPSATPEATATPTATPEASATPSATAASHASAPKKATKKAKP